MRPAPKPNSGFSEFADKRWVELLARGRYSRDLAQHLPDVGYSGLPAEGAVVLGRIFIWDYGFDDAWLRAFASTLGISDPWDLNQQHIDPDRIDLEALEGFLHAFYGTPEGVEDDEIAEPLLALRTVVSRGFDLFFAPNRAAAD